MAQTALLGSLFYGDTIRWVKECFLMFNLACLFWIFMLLPLVPVSSLDISKKASWQKTCLKHLLILVTSSKRAIFTPQVVDTSLHLRLGSDIFPKTFWILLNLGRKVFLKLSFSISDSFRCKIPGNLVVEEILVLPGIGVSFPCMVLFSHFLHGFFWHPQWLPFLASYGLFGGLVFGIF